MMNVVSIMIIVNWGVFFNRSFNVHKDNIQK